MSEGPHKFSELNKPTQTYYPDLYFYEVVGWKDSRDAVSYTHLVSGWCEETDAFR